MRYWFGMLCVVSGIIWMNMYGAPSWVPGLFVAIWGTTMMVVDEA